MKHEKSEVVGPPRIIIGPEANTVTASNVDTATSETGDECSAPAPYSRPRGSRTIPPRSTRTGDGL